MKRITLLACASVFALAPLAAMAQSATATDVQRDVNQQRRIQMAENRDSRQIQRQKHNDHWRN